MVRAEHLNIKACPEVILPGMFYRENRTCWRLSIQIFFPVSGWRNARRTAQSCCVVSPTASDQSREAAVVFFVNLFLALLNLIPADKLDMWNALYCLLMEKFDEERTENVLSAASGIAVALFCIFCVLYFVFIGFNISLLAVCLYLIYLRMGSA